MKIAVLNGSTRKNGSTGMILKTIANNLSEKSDVELNYYDLNDYKIEYCTGCRVCYKTGRCTIKSDDIEKLSLEIKKSDGIIIGSSTFGSNITGKLKSFLDRGHFIVEQSLYNKYGFSVATYEIAEGKKTLDIIKKFFLVSGAIRTETALKKIDFNRDVLKDKRFILKLKKRSENFYKAIKNKKRRSFFEFIFTKIVLIPLIWKPRFLRKKDEYAGILKSWEEKGLI